MGANEEHLMSPREAAAFLQINEQTVRRLAREKKLPAVKVGGTWRFCREQLENREPQKSARAEKKKPHILVVDDDRGVCRLVERVLSKCEYNISVVHDGYNAVEAFTAVKPDMVLLDLAMPGMTGVDVLRWVREKDAILPVLLITAYPQSSLVRQALHHSPFTLLAKPFKNQQLADVVQQCLGG